jgi:hypothetical protein
MPYSDDSNYPQRVQRSLPVGVPQPEPDDKRILKPPLHANGISGGP